MKWFNAAGVRVCGQGSGQVMRLGILLLEQLRDFARAHIDATDRLVAIVNGSPLSGLFSHRAESPVFSLDFTNTCNLVSFLLGSPFSGLDDPIVADRITQKIAAQFKKQHLQSEDEEDHDNKGHKGKSERRQD